MTTEYNRVMLDLETLGTRPGCVVLSIGAVFFSATAPNWKGPTFYAPINKASCLTAGLHEDPDTVAWWAKQGDAARTVLADSQAESTPPLAKVLEAFGGWLQTHAATTDVQVWGNGSDFDNAVLAHAYHAVGQKPPWHYHNSRCYRTLKAFRRSVKLERTGTHHNALDDAVCQAEHAVRLLKAING